jgi:mono/diheme cytochrome c family protein
LKGEGGRGPNLITGQFYHGSTDADLMRNISDGIPGTAMPGVFFSPIQVSQLVAYIRSVSQHGSSERPEGNAAKGAELFHDKGCGGCHLVRGEGIRYLAEGKGKTLLPYPFVRSLRWLDLISFAKNLSAY